jgi:hypothetical protein
LFVEKMNFEKTIRTYLLANLNLEGEIHLKGVRLVISQNFERIKNLCTHKIITSFHAHASILSSYALVYQRFLTFSESKSFPVIKQQGGIYLLQSSKLV